MKISEFLIRDILIAVTTFLIGIALWCLAKVIYPSSIWLSYICGILGFVLTPAGMFYLVWAFHKEIYRLEDIKEAEEKQKTREPDFKFVE